MALKIPNPFKFTAFLLSAAVTLWLAGFFIFFFNVANAKPAYTDKTSDVVVVLTGGPGRVEQGLDLMARQQAKAMLVTGVHPDVSLQILIDRWSGDAQAKETLKSACCIFIDHKAESTEDNAIETRNWLERNGGAKDVRVRMVTSDYHMPRARLLFHRAMPDVTLEPWPVLSPNVLSFAFLRTVLIEYSKTLLTLMN